MTKRFAVILLTLVAVVLSVPASQAAEFYAGAGVLTNSFSADLKPGKWFELSGRTGVGFNVGYRLARETALDATIGVATMKDELSGSDARYIQIEAGPVFIFNVNSTIRPFLEAGLGAYTLDIGDGDLEYDGMGAYLGAGIEEYSGLRHSVKIYARGKYWKGDPFEMDAAVLSFGLIYNYHFGDLDQTSSGGRWIESVR